MGISLIPTLIGIIFFRNKSENEKTKYVLWLFLILAVFFCTYKLLMPLDKEYLDIYDKYYGGFTYLNELPLNPCNITLLLFPFAIVKKNNTLLAACFYEAMLGALLAVVTPIFGFDGSPVFSVHILGYYITHMTLFFSTFLIYSFGIYVPKYKDTGKAIFAMFLISCGVFVIDIFLRTSGLCKNANYFFLFSHDGNAILKFVYDLIPIPFVFTVLTGLVIMAILIPIIVTLFNGWTALKNKFTFQNAE